MHATRTGMDVKMSSEILRTCCGTNFDLITYDYDLFK